MPAQHSALWEDIEKVRVMEVCGEGSFEVGWSGDLLSMHTLVFSEYCSMHTHYPFKRQVEEEKGRKWSWRVNGRYLALTLSPLLHLLCFTFFSSFMSSFQSMCWIHEVCLYLCNNAKTIFEEPCPKMHLPFCLGDQVASRKSRAAVWPELDGCEPQWRVPESEAGAPALPYPALHWPAAKGHGHQSQRCENLGSFSQVNCQE